MCAKQTIEALVTGGSATAGPPLGPMLGPLGVNVLAVVNRINEITSDFAGMKVPVEVVVDVDTKEFNVDVGIPTTSALIAKEAKLEKGSQAPGTDYVGDIGFDQILSIAKIVNQKLKLRSLKSVAMQVLGTCRSMGVKVDGRSPLEVTDLIRKGEYDDRIAEG
ncbi:MAG: 50S ribosomal protein L11 [Nitrososphaeria archaeon]|nr:50S ribosomal protein L11 [Nitrososphaeria archaeon]NIN53268.1 50S ribosomal protein L11 [Nitrososphaeria archaeon]NIQ33719.1 50S ribosomal protein L11 [Nitrososphaeria archaeon]